MFLRCLKFFHGLVVPRAIALLAIKKTMKYRNPSIANMTINISITSTNAWLYGLSCGAITPKKTKIK